MSLLSALSKYKKDIELPTLMPYIDALEQYELLQEDDKLWVDISNLYDYDKYVIDLALYYEYYNGKLKSYDKFIEFLKEEGIEFTIPLVPAIVKYFKR